MSARVLVVGGAGYIGSVCAHYLRGQGHAVDTFDDLSTGHREAAQGTLIVGDIRDRAFLTQVLRDGRYDAVMHFAAKSLVGESVRHPRRYFDVNTGGTAALLQAMEDTGVEVLVFSSTCAIYGDPVRLPLDEEHPRAPVSPYGESKDLVERMLASCRARDGLRVTTLRYFNAAGALPDGSLGESHSPETHLIPLALAAALGQRPPLELYGTDYETRDGTCVRDYVHVLDLANAHALAMERLLAGDSGNAFNLGSETGSTVREVISSVERVLGRPVPHKPAARRPGDPPALWATSARVRSELGWIPTWTDLDEIVRTAATWATSPRY